MPDMEGDVEVRVVHPDRPALVEGDEGQALAIARNEVQPAGDLLHQLVVGGGVALEHHASGDVHVRGVALEVQERAVESRQAVWIGHGVILARHPGVTMLTQIRSRRCEPRRFPERPAESSLPGAEMSGGPTAGLAVRHPARGESAAWRTQPQP
jgi:hypothetical protein